ncbi:hypothetical protein HG263_17205 [Pseudoalteromonas sp. JBTF-M23]|uniref:PKD/Chitinase domain-containing protein n=1 Tax=Pseudoalteromonas caenipelagi TaxID=2726988 RepID=A0A849VHH3_9GAMM|nr:hypothetical protein [Pseudoalteromonas caenipelagi]NOU52270.1 hypothetical protein [Pseudoalteromonas caenipelagi]
MVVYKTFLIFLVYLTLLSGCGGGSAPSSNQPPVSNVENNHPSNQAPISNAGNDQSVNELNTVVLSGAESTSEKSIKHYAWSQVGNGPRVTIKNANSIYASFTAPEVNAEEETLLKFQLVVTDQNGLSSSDTIQVNVKDISVNPSELIFTNHLEFENKISLKYSDLWQKINYTHKYKSLVTFYERPGNNDDLYQASIKLYKTDQDIIALENISNFQEISRKLINAGGFEGQEIIFSGELLGQEQYDLMFMQFTIEFNGMNYLLFYTAERKTFGRNIEVVRHMSKSIEIGQVLIDNLSRDSDLTDPGKPAIANDGINHLIVSCREESDFPYSGQLIGKVIFEDRTTTDEFTIVPASGENTGSSGCGFSTFLRSYSAIFDGTNFLLTYSGKVDGTVRILAKRISPEGVVLDNTPIIVSQNTTNAVYQPTIAFGTNRSLVVWHEKKDVDLIKAAFVDSEGKVTDSFNIVDDVGYSYVDSEHMAYTPQVAYGDGKFMIVWSPHFFRGTRSSSMPVYGQLVDINGNTLLSQPVEIRKDDGNNPRYVQIASDGTNFLIGWIEGLLEDHFIDGGSFTIYARHVSPHGKLLNGGSEKLGLEISPILMADEEREVAKNFLNLSFHDDNYLFFWSAGQYTQKDGVYGVKVSKDLSTVSESIPIIGTRGESSNDNLGVKASPMNISHTDDQSFIVWPSMSGDLEGWRIDEESFN